MENLRPWGCIGYVHNTSHRYGKLGLVANKNVFIKYSGYSRDYVMYDEHPNEGLVEIESRDVDLIENDFPNIGKVKKKS